MGSYTFTWEHAASEVYVTGDFDQWKQTIKLEKEDGIFQKTVELPKEKHQYKFVVDGSWLTNETHPKEDDGKGNYNNVLRPSDIKDGVSTLSSAAPFSTTAALAGAVPKEGAKEEASRSGDSLPGAFPLTPPTETPGTEPQAFSVNPLPATDGPGNPIKLAPGEPVPDPSTFTNNTVQSTVKDGKAPEKEEQTFGVAPIPAIPGAGNPVHLEPGEKVPDPSTFTSNTVQSTVKTDPASYEQADALPPQLAPVVTPDAEREAKGGMFGLPPLSGKLIPESSLPKDSNTEYEKDPGVTIQSAAPVSTTAALAGEVPKEPKAVPETVTESQKEAEFPPEASANAQAVEEKKEVEQELKQKVPEEPPAAESTLTEKAGVAAAAGATAAAGVAGTFAAATYSAKDKAAEAVGVNGQAPASEVPEVVAESQQEAHVSPEASANKEAVVEKKEVEAELLKEVKKTNEAGEPAPAITAATSATAPGEGVQGDTEPALSQDALADEKPLKSSSEPDALNAAASKPAEPETSKPVVDSRDVSPMSKQPTTATQNQPTVTTGGETSKTEAKTSAPETPKKDAEPSSAKGTPGSVASAATDKSDKKKKRTSIFGKLKAKLKGSHEN